MCPTHNEPDPTGRTRRPFGDVREGCEPTCNHCWGQFVARGTTLSERADGVVKTDDGLVDAVRHRATAALRRVRGAIRRLGALLGA
jgi:tRNA A37 methylthiotransferase MiaB